MKQEHDKLIEQLRNAKAVVSNLEDSLRQFTYALTDNPYETWLKYLHIELSNAHNMYAKNNIPYCKEKGLMIETIQNEARLDAIIALLQDIPSIFVPEELKKLYNLVEKG